MDDNWKSSSKLRAARLILITDAGEWRGASITDPNSPVLGGNSNCTVDPVNSHSSGTGQTLTLDLAVNFTYDQPHQRLKNINFFVGDRGGDIR